MILLSLFLFKKKKKECRPLQKRAYVLSRTLRVVLMFFIVSSSEGGKNMVTRMLFGNRVREKDSVTINDETSHTKNLLNNKLLGSCRFQIKIKWLRRKT